MKTIPQEIRKNWFEDSCKAESVRPESEGCKRFDGCSAPLCPMDKGSLSNGIWYPMESYCTYRAYSNLLWVRRQRKISKKVRNQDFYFNYEMLCRNCRITAATEGLDADRTKITEAQQLKRWLKRHPEIRKISEAEKVEVVHRLKKGLNLHKKKAVNRGICEKKYAPTGNLKR